MTFCVFSSLNSHGMTETALEAHVSTSAEAEERLVYVGDLHGELFRVARTFRPHEASPIPEVRNGCPARHFVLRSRMGGKRRRDGDCSTR